MALRHQQYRRANGPDSARAGPDQKVGLNAVLKPIDKAVQRQKRYSGDFDIDIGGLGAGGLDSSADALLFAKFHNASPGNYSHINDPKLDEFAEASRREAEPGKARALFRQA